MFKKLLEDITFEIGSIDEFNLNQSKAKIFNKIVKKYNNDTYINPDFITSSSGLVIVLIYNNFVIKLFNNLDVCKKVISIIKVGKRSKFTIKMLGYILNELDNFNLIITEKIEPLTIITLFESELQFNIFENEYTLMKLLIQTGDSLSYIHSENCNHGDITLDNIGFKNGNFKIFDFNCSKKYVTNHKRDMDILLKSIDFYLDKYKIKNKFKRLLLYLKNSFITDGNKLVNCIYEYYKEYYGSCDDNNILIFNKLSSIEIKILGFKS